MKKDKIFLFLSILAVILIIVIVFNLNYFFGLADTEAEPIAITPSFVSEMSSSNASATVFVFSDFQCPFCSSQAEPLHQIKEYYGDNVNIVFKHLIVHEGSLSASLASECARDQGKFWEYHDLLFANQAAQSDSDLANYAQTLGLDLDQFNQCMVSVAKYDIIQQDMQQAVDAGITGTPSLIINGQLYKGVQDFSTLQEIIDPLLI